MTDKKKIIFFMPNLLGGGTERVASRLSFLFEQEGYNVTFLVYEKTVAYAHAGNIISMNLPGTKNCLNKFLKQFLRFYYLRKILKDVQPWAVLSFLEGPNMLNVLCSKRAIISIRNVIPLNYSTILQRIIIKLFYNKASCLIVNSNYLAEELSTRYSIRKSRIKTIYNPIDVEYITESAKEKLQKNLFPFCTNPYFIAIGSMTKQKNYISLLRCFSFFLTKNSKYNLLILGEGHLRPKIEATVKQLGLEKKVLLPGFVDNPFPALSQSSMFILPSLHEGFPNVLAEALALNIPCLSADCHSGPREILLKDYSLNQLQNTFEETPYGVLAPIPTALDKVLLSESEIIFTKAMHHCINEKWEPGYPMIKKRFNSFKIFLEYSDAVCRVTEGVK